MENQKKTNNSVTYGAIALAAVLVIGGVSFFALNRNRSAETTNTSNTSQNTSNQNANADQNSQRTIVEIASSDSRFSTLVSALRAADLVDALNGSTEYTVFAPTNEAFAKLPPAVLNDLVSNPDKKNILANILRYHVVNGEVTASQVVNLTSAKALNNTEIRIARNGSDVMLNSMVKVTQTDIQARNGVIHVIDTVLINDPVDTLTSLGGFTSLATALTRADLVNTLKGAGPFTIFAPTDAAFAKIDPTTLNALLTNPGQLQTLKNILTYHVAGANVPSSEVVKLTTAPTVNGKALPIQVQNGAVILNGNSRVVITDVPVSNGIVHVIDTVMIP